MVLCWAVLASLLTESQTLFNISLLVMVHLSAYFLFCHLLIYCSLIMNLENKNKNVDFVLKQKSTSKN